MDAMKGKLQVKTKKEKGGNDSTSMRLEEGKAEEEEWDEMEGKPYAMIKREKENR